MYQLESNADVTTVYVRCDVDFAEKADFEAVLRYARSLGSARMVVSLEECPYLDCAGVSVLVKLRNEFAVPVSVVLHDDSHLWKVFSLLGLRERLNVTCGARAALAASNIVDRRTSRMAAYAISRNARLAKPSNVEPIPA